MLAQVFAALHLSHAAGWTMLSLLAVACVLALPGLVVAMRSGRVGRLCLASVASLVLGLAFAAWFVTKERRLMVGLDVEFDPPGEIACVAAERHSEVLLALAGAAFAWTSTLFMAALLASSVRRAGWLRDRPLRATLLVASTAIAMTVPAAMVVRAVIAHHGAAVSNTTSDRDVGMRSGDLAPRVNLSMRRANAATLAEAGPVLGALRVAAVVFGVGGCVLALAVLAAHRDRAYPRSTHAYRRRLASQPTLPRERRFRSAEIAAAALLFTLGVAAYVSTRPLGYDAAHPIAVDDNARRAGELPDLPLSVSARCDPPPAALVGTVTDPWNELWLPERPGIVDRWALSAHPTPVSIFAPASIAIAAIGRDLGVVRDRFGTDVRIATIARHPCPSRTLGELVCYRYCYVPLHLNDAGPPLSGAETWDEVALAAQGSPSELRASSQR